MYYRDSNKLDINVGRKCYRITQEQRGEKKTKENRPSHEPKHKAWLYLLSPFQLVNDGPGLASSSAGRPRPSGPASPSLCSLPLSFFSQRAWLVCSPVSMLDCLPHFSAHISFLHLILSCARHVRLFPSPSCFSSSHHSFQQARLKTTHDDSSLLFCDHSPPSHPKTAAFSLSSFIPS